MTALRTLRPVFALFWAHDRRRLAYGALLSFTTALAGIALLGLSGWFIAATALAGASVATALTFDVFMPSAGIRLLALGRTASRYGERLVTHDATLRVLAHLREKLFRGWAQPDAAHALAHHPSRLLFRLTIDIDALDSLYLRVIVPVLASAGAALALAAALAFVDPTLALATGAVLLAVGLGLPFVAGLRAAAASRRRAHALEALRARTIDLVRGQADLAMANRLGAQLRAVTAADQRLGEADLALNRTETNVSFGLGILSAVLLSGMVVAVALLAERGATGAPVAALCVLLTLAVLEPFAALRRGAVEFGRTLLAAQRLGPRLGPAVPAPASAPASAMPVQLDAVTLHHAGSSRPALSGLSLTIAPGERVAIIGVSGAGKSTLLAALAGEILPTSGTIKAQPTSLLTQRTELFRDSVSGNLTLADTNASDAAMHAALHAAGLDAVVAALPSGLDTRLGEGGAGLSAGQARRLALARLLLRNAPVWLLDEPTEGLDGDTARDVVARLARRADGHTLLIATHTQREAALADRLIWLRDGTIAADCRRQDPDFSTLLATLRPD